MNSKKGAAKKTRCALHGPHRVGRWLNRGFYHAVPGRSGLWFEKQGRRGPSAVRLLFGGQCGGFSLSGACGKELLRILLHTSDQYFEMKMRTG